MPDSTWQKLYNAALVELQPAKLNERIEAARQAIHRRLVREIDRVGKEEREEIDEALRTLHILTRQKKKKPKRAAKRTQRRSVA